MIVILPVRSRPKNLPRFLDSWLDTRAQAKLVVAADADDPDLKEYKAIQNEYGDWVDLRIAPRMMLAPKLNYHAVAASGEYDIIGFLADDLICRTKNWDVMIKQSMDRLGGVGVVHPNDMVHNGAIPTHVFMSSVIVQTLGWMVPPGFVHLYSDNAWQVIGQTLGKMHYQHDVIMEHMHPCVNKGEWDDIYRLANSGQRWEEDSRTFEEWRTEGSYIEPLRSLRA